MNINRTLSEELSEVNLGEYGCWQDELDRFVEWDGTFMGRQEEAGRIIERIMTAHQKEELFQCVVELARVERGIRELKPKVRDHVVHALLSFILGMYVNECFMDATQRATVTSLQWKLAGMFHDVAYPVQIAPDIMRPFAETMNSIRDRLGVPAPDVFFRVVPVGLELLQHGKNALQLLQNVVDEWGLAVRVGQEYENMINSTHICHGMISSLAVMHVIDLMYERCNPQRKREPVVVQNTDWNQVHFERQVVPACAAIFLHNLPERCFRNARIDTKRAPLPFLLKLCDTLQDWERPSACNPRGLSPERFDITVEHGRLVFQAEVEAERKEKYKRELSSTLIAHDIIVQ